MKQFRLLLVLLLTSLAAWAQPGDPQEVTPELLKKIKADAEVAAQQFRKTLPDSDGWSEERKEFAVDTFKIEYIVSRRMDLDYSTQGMNMTVIESTEAYDKLLNKYYNKLMAILAPEDKKVLQTAQRAWLVYRDAERKLIGLLRNDKYSGGGTIQSNISVGRYATIVEARVFRLFDYYDEVIKE